MRKPLFALAVIAALLLLSPQAGAWTFRTHGRQALVAYDALPENVRAKLDPDLIYQGSNTPDTWRDTGRDTQGGKTYTATSNSGDAWRAFDGNPGTRWVAAGGAGENITVDLGMSYQMNQITFTGAPVRSRVQILRSDDGTVWYEVENKSMTDNFVKVFNVYCWGRHWRFRCLSVPSGENFGFTDIYVIPYLDNAHKAIARCKPGAGYWLRRAKSAWDVGAYDNVAIYMGVAAHYIGDGFTMVHNDNVWDNTNSLEDERGGWSKHKHFEELVRYYEPATPSYMSGYAGLDNYIENYLWVRMDQFASETWSGGRYFRWENTRDCGMVKGDVDNATSYIYNAWMRVVGEVPPGGGGGGTQQGLALGSGGDLGAMAAVAGFGLCGLLLLRRGRSSSTAKDRRRRGRLPLLREQRGISPVFGAAIIFSLLAVATVTITVRVIPEYQRRNEAAHMDEVHRASLKLHRAITSGENCVIDLKLSAEPVEILWGAIRGPMPMPSIVMITPARHVMRISAENDAYVDNASPDTNYNENYLWVRSSPRSCRRTFLKFNLSALPADADVYDARLLIYVESLSRFHGTPLDPNENVSLVPIQIGVLPVENDNWREDNITWTWAASALPQYGGVHRDEDYPYDNKWNLFIEESWFSVNVTSFVKGQRGDGRASFCVKADKENSSMDRYAIFKARENLPITPSTWLHPNVRDYHAPHLQITYTSSGTPPPSSARDNYGIILEGGEISIKTQNRSFPQQSFIIEGGALILWQWYRTDTLAAPAVLSYSKAGDDNIRLTVNHYRIVNPRKISLERGGSAKLRVTVENIYYMLPGDNSIYRQRPTLARPNIDNVTITIRTDYPAEWRETHPFLTGGHLTELTSRFYVDPKGKLDQELGNFNGADADSNWGDISNRDWWQRSITIRGKGREGENDIYLMERFIDVRVELEG